MTPFEELFGQDDLLANVTISLVAGGHVLIEGVPGLGKTMLVRTLAQAVDCVFSRIQFTPDLMPADILGSEVLDTGEDGTRTFRFIPGPIFCQLLMAGTGAYTVFGANSNTERPGISGFTALGQ